MTDLAAVVSITTLNGAIHSLVPFGVVLALVGGLALIGGRGLARRVAVVTRRRRLRDRLQTLDGVRARHHLALVPPSVVAPSHVVWGPAKRPASGSRTQHHIEACAERAARLRAHLQIAGVDERLVDECARLAHHLRGLRDSLSERSAR